jgi:CheY-like chemotaxis protein
VKLRIIVFEDDEAIRQSLTLLLRRNGYEVISASDPTSCPVCSTRKEACSPESVCGDFLLTDNQMPNLTGLGFIEAQSRRGGKGIAANKAVMSGTWSSEERKKAKKLGCEIFTKPFRIEEIIEWLDERKKLIPPGRKLTVIGTRPESPLVS